MRKNDNSLSGIGKTISLLLLLFCITVGSPLHAVQKPGKKEETTEKKQRTPRSPKKAMLMALLPGMGQAYNHKYWKMPFVYAGFGVIGYFAVVNQNEYTKYRIAYTCKISDPNCTNPISLKYQESTLRTIRDYYRRNMQLSYIVMGAWYMLQMIDANVDAHLSHWDISDNLALDVTPIIGPTPNKPSALYKGLSLHFSF